jgi:ribosomal protein L28
VVFSFEFLAFSFFMSVGYRCDWCQKGVDYGQYIRHRKGVAGGRWKRKAQKKKRIQLPNLHAARVMVDKKGVVINKESKKVGVVKKLRLCTKCLRRAKRPGRVEKEDKGEKAAQEK